MSNFKPSVYQQGIYDFITNGKGNAVVSAVAGSGKTTTLINALNLIPDNLNVLFMAFNKSIAEELKGRVPKNANNISVKTIHSYGYFSLTKDMKIEIDANKYKKMLRQMVAFFETGDYEQIKKYKFDLKQMSLLENFEFDDSEKQEIQDKVGYFNRVLSLCDLGRLNLVDLNNQDNGVQMLYDIAKKHNIDIINGECYRAWLLIQLGSSVLSSADFTDMVFLPIYLKLKTRQYDIVFIDECQDLNTCQRTLMEKAIKKDTGRFIAVGDPAQAIYGFSGADADSFKKLTEIPNTIQLPLSVCYRCGSDIIEFAKKLVPQLEASPTAKKGMIDYNYSYKNVVENDMIICRNTMPLVSLCMRYLKQGKKSFVMGTDISASLINMVDGCRRKTEIFSIENVFARIYKEKSKLVQNIMKKENITQEDAEENSLVIAFMDKVNTLEVLSDGCDTGDDLIEKLKEIFKDDSKDGICLSTIHKSKGLEADRVFIIHSDLMPSKHAKKDWEKEQEKNLQYVAYTRAKSLLGFITDFDAFSTHESKENDIELKESDFVGEIGSKIELELTITLKKDMLTSYGDTTLYEMVDKQGNLFSKFGNIPDRFLISNHLDVEEGSIVKFYATIKAHKDFKGIKTNVISTIARS